MKPTKTTIRDAAPEDLEALSELRLAFFEDQITAGMTDSLNTFKMELAKTTENAIDKRRKLCLVAERDGSLIGYLYTIFKLTPSEKIASIEEVFVSDKARKSGVAEQLFHATDDRLEPLNITRLQLRVLVGNARGMAFWTHMGFTQYLVHMERNAGKIPNK